MIFKYIRTLNLILLQKHSLSTNKNQSQKSKKSDTRIPPIQKAKQVDIKNMNFDLVPQQYRKGVKGNIQAQRLMTTADSQLKAQSLKIIIDVQRQKLLQTINSYGNPIKYGNPSQSAQQKNKFNKQNQKQNLKEKFYDVMKPLTLFARISSVIATINLGIFSILRFDENYLYLGYFLGGALNPSLIFINGIVIGFNCAIWIIQQSLHIHLKQVGESQVNLIKSSILKIVQIGLILIQLMGLGYYLMNPDIFAAYPYILVSSVLSQIHLLKNLASISMGRFSLFMYPALFNWFASAILLYLFLYLVKFIGYILDGKEESALDEESLHLKQNIQKMKLGHVKFLQLLREKDSVVIAGQKINKLVL